MIPLENILKRSLQDVLKTYSKRLEDVLKISWRRFCKTSWRRFKDVLKMSWRRLEDVFKTSWRLLEDVLKTFLQDVLKTSWRCYGKTSWRRLEDVWRTKVLVLTKTSSEDVWLRWIYSSWSRRLEDVLKTKDVFKTSSGCLYQDEYLLGGDAGLFISLGSARFWFFSFSHFFSWYCLIFSFNGVRTKIGTWH